MAGVEFGSDYDIARTRKMNAEAEMSELELAKVHGALVVADHVVDAWNDVLGSFKAKLMSVPSKLAPIVSAEDDPALCQKIVEDVINETLEELSSYTPEIDPTKANVSEIVEEEKPKAKRGRPKKTTAKKVLK
jgi:hypothetical protein